MSAAGPRSTTRPHGWVALAIAALLAAAWISGCAGDDPLGTPGARENEPDDPAFVCEDSDGDGLGVGCPMGPDCDDRDALSAKECFVCQHDAPGCPCGEEGARIVCGEVESHVGEQLVCGMGDSVCSGGVWAECIINNTITLAAGPEEHTLGAPKTCSNPCDPYCQTYVDTPTGLGDPDGGIIATDAGISLPGSAPAPPATCTGGSDGTCVHAMCVTGAKLTPGCDATNPPPGPAILFQEDFANNSKGWTVNGGTEWKIALPAAASVGHQTGFPDPAVDHTPTADNRIAGVVIGGNASTVAHAFHYLVSPVINAGPPVQAPLTLTFWRWLNSDYANYMVNRVEACNTQANCTVLWQSGAAPGVADSAWTLVQLPIPAAYKTANLQIRFGFSVGAGAFKASSWNIDDVTVTGTAQPPPLSSCVASICNVMPACCTPQGGWTQACIDKLLPVCGVTCNNVNGTCVSCYNDAFDHDGDGFSGTAGDCLDCDPNVSPGAFDFPANTLDEDCSGTADDEPLNCDGALPMASSNPYDYAKAIDLCRTATAASKNWGVITPGAALVQANVGLAGGTPVTAPGAMTYGILPKFGTNNVPQKGARMAAFSSGTARAPGDPGWVNPNGQVASYNANTSCALPPNFPKGSACYPNDTASAAYDSSGVWMKIRVPTNAKSFSFNFNMFSAEYPEWVCTAFNDTFIARLLTGFSSPPNPAVNGNNISFDANAKPVTINNALFTVPGCATCQSAKLLNTGFDASCGGQRCGGATDWLVTTAPVVPGETISMHFSIWDEGDHAWDSIVLLDNWQWSVKPATISTTKLPPPQPTQYTDGYFVRDYDASGLCEPGMSIVWGHWSWQAVTPGNSFIDFTVKTAATQAGLAAAPADPLQFSNPPGPAGLAGQPAIARTGPPNTVNGSAVVDATLDAKLRPTTLPWVRITSHLAPSSDKLLAPTLSAWNLQVSCVWSE